MDEINRYDTQDYENTRIINKYLKIMKIILRFDKVRQGSTFRPTG